MIKNIKGDLIKLAKKGEFDVICHGCNIFNTMGSGIAKTIRDEWPETYLVDCETTSGDKFKLGTITFTKNIPGLTVVNCYTQEKYGRDVKVYADYDAIEKALTIVKNQFLNKKIGMPKIGAGLARGDWNVIMKIIEKVFSEPTDDVTIVEWDGDDNNAKSSSKSVGIQNPAISKLSAFNSLTKNNNTTTPMNNNPTPSQKSSIKKFRGKRKCKVCHTSHPIKEMHNYLLGVWVCQEKCNQILIDKVMSINNLVLTQPTQQIAASPVLD